MNSVDCQRRFLVALVTHGTVAKAMAVTGERAKQLYLARRLWPKFGAAWGELVPPTPEWRTRPRRHAKQGWQDRLIIAIWQTGNKRQAARIAGVHPSTVDDERRRCGKFAADYHAARRDGISEVLINRAYDKGFDPKLALRVLEVMDEGVSHRRIRPLKDEK